MRSSLLTGLVMLALTGPASPGDAAGAAWVPVLRATEGYVTLALFPDGVAYAKPDSRGYQRSTDFGVTWTPMPYPNGKAGGQIYDLRFATPAVGYVLAGTATDVTAPRPPTRCGDNMPLLRTDDGGQTWAEVCMPRPPRQGTFSTGFHALAVAGGGRTMSLTGSDAWHSEGNRKCPRSAGTVYTSHDSGAHWTRWQWPRGNWGGHQVEWLDPRTAVLLATATTYRPDGICHDADHTRPNTVWITRDGGRTFRKVLDCKPALCTAATFVTKDRLVVGFHDGNTKVSTDSGRRWQAGQRLVNSVHVPHYPPDDPSTLDHQSQHMVQDFSFVDARHGFASTLLGGTWRTSNGGDSWVQERSHECHFWPFGLGEIAAVTKDRALTGGPGWISARVPAEADVPPCEQPRQIG